MKVIINTNVTFTCIKFDCISLPSFTNWLLLLENLAIIIIIIKKPNPDSFWKKQSERPVAILVYVTVEIVCFGWERFVSLYCIYMYMCVGTTLHM
jgi:hypothetical protein